MNFPYESQYGDEVLSARVLAGIQASLLRNYLTGIV